MDILKPCPKSKIIAKTEFPDVKFALYNDPFSYDSDDSIDSDDFENDFIVFDNPGDNITPEEVHENAPDANEDAQEETNEDDFDDYEYENNDEIVYDSSDGSDTDNDEENNEEDVVQDFSDHSDDSDLDIDDINGFDYDYGNEYEELEYQQEYEFL